MSLRIAAIFLFISMFPVEGRCAESARAQEGKESGAGDRSAAPGTEKEPADPWALLPDMVVTPNRRESRLFEQPFSVQVYGSKDIGSRGMYRTTPDVFSDDPAVVVQKTSYGQGSPFLRGLTGFRTLFMIDGIRLNNSTFREGPNQYWNTVDPFLIDRMEVVKGIASVLYGSDAIGGAVNALSRRNTEFGEGWGMGGAAHLRGTTPDMSAIVRIEANANAGRAAGIHAGATYKDFNDFTAGPHVGLNEHSGYGEWDCDLRCDFYPDPSVKITAAFQRTDQRNIRRTHSTIYGIPWHLTSVGTDLDRSSDQWRDLGYVQVHAKDMSGLLKNASLSVSCHHQREREFRMKSNGTSDVQVCDVVTPGLWGTLELDTPAGAVTAGFEYYRDFVGTAKDSYNADGSFKGGEIQGPVADHSSYDLLGLFVQDEYSPTDELRFSAGIRYTLATLIAGRVKDPDTGTRIRLSDTYDNFSFAARAGFSPADSLNIYAGLSTGFRAPNLSDLTRLDIAKSSEIETPSPGLESELFTSIDIGVKFRYETILKAELSFFYTIVNDMIVRYPTGAVIDGKNEVRKANVGDGWISGMEASGSWSPVKELEFKAGAALTQGKVDTYASSAKIKSREWISRVPPTSGMLSGRYTGLDDKWWVELAWKWAWRQRKLSPSDESDTQRIPPGGTPGYGVVNIRGGMALSKSIGLSLAVLNLANKDYRIHGSGQNEPGLQVQASMDLKF